MPGNQGDFHEHRLINALVLVLIKHPWSMTWKELYIDYQPWLTLIYISIFVSPFIGAIFFRDSVEKNHLILRWFSGGEKGIRTLDTFRYTRFPGARVRPDYATSPFDPYGCDRNFTINKLDREGK